VTRLARAEADYVGTSHTMSGPLYPRALAARGITAELPAEDDCHLIKSRS